MSSHRSHGSLHLIASTEESLGSCEGNVRGSRVVCSKHLMLQVAFLSLSLSASLSGHTWTHMCTHVHKHTHTYTHTHTQTGSLCLALTLFLLAKFLPQSPDHNTAGSRQADVRNKRCSISLLQSDLDSMAWGPRFTCHPSAVKTDNRKQTAQTFRS